MAKGKQTPVTTRIVWGLVLLFLLVTIISQLVIHFYNPLKIEYAELYSSSSFVQLTGVYVRNERLVNYNGGGVVSFVHDDGEKLAKNSVIAKIYSSSSDLAIQAEIDALEEQIAVLKDAESLVGSDNSQLAAFSNQIYENHNRMLQYIAAGDYKSAADMKSEYLNLQSKRLIVRGDEADYSAKISELQEQIRTLKSQISAKPQDLLLNETGYFVSNADGYENVLNYDSIGKLTEEQIGEIIKNPQKEVSANAIGKIVSDYRWKMVSVIESSKAKNVYEGAKVRLRIGTSAQEVTVTVEKITQNQQTGNSILVFSCDRLNSGLVAGRTVQFKLLFDDYKGIRIPSEAIRFNEEGEAGVFVKVGVEIVFKKIEVVVNEGDYAIVEDTTEKNGYLSLYDMVVVEGTDLYDGKIILQ